MPDRLRQDSAHAHRAQWAWERIRSRKQSNDPTERRIFNPHVVAHADVLAQDALDAVQRTADDSGCTRRDFVRFELGGGKQEAAHSSGRTAPGPPAASAERGSKGGRSAGSGFPLARSTVPSATPEILARGARGAPRPEFRAGRIRCQPPRSKQPAAATVAGLTPSLRARSRTVGSTSPGPAAPMSTASRSMPRCSRRASEPAHFVHYNTLCLIRSRLSAPLAAIESSPRRPLERRQCPVPTGPASEYRLRLSRLDSARRALARQDRRFSYARLLTFAAGALLIAGWRALTPFWLVALPAVVFLMLVQRHDRVLRRFRGDRSIGFYERGLARIEDCWVGTGEPGDRFRDDRHLFANDLDLFGPGSLFELLSIARTRAGEETLAQWLKHPALPDEIRARQEAISELTPALDLETLSLAGSDLRAAVTSDTLIRWAEGAAVLRRRWQRGVATALTAMAVTAAVYALLTGDLGPFLAVVAAEVFSIPLRASVQQALHAAEGPARDLDVLAHVVGCLERADLKTTRLTGLQDEAQHRGMPASRAIRRLHFLVELHDWQHNQFFAPVAAAFLWGTHLAWAIESWRRAHGNHASVAHDRRRIRGAELAIRVPLRASRRSMARNRRRPRAIRSDTDGAPTYPCGACRAKRCAAVE